MATPKHIVLLAPKGGVGKSTIAANLAASFSLKRKKILLLELDQQFALQNHFSSFLNSESLRSPSLDAEINVISNQRREIGTSSNGIDILPIPHSKKYLDQFIQSGRDQVENDSIQSNLNDSHYDIAVIDTKTGSEEWMSLAGSANCIFVICINPDVASFSTLAPTLAHFRSMNDNGYAVSYKLLINRMDSAVALASDTYAVINEVFSEQLLENKIPVDPAFSESFAKGCPILAYSPYSKASTSIDELAQSLLDHDRDMLHE